MNTIFKFAKAAFVALSLMLATTVVAQAQESTSTCYDCQPAPTNSFGVSIGGGAAFGGFGGGMFEGTEGYAIVEKNGYGGVDIGLTGEGAGCVVDCGTLGWTFNGYAGEHVTVGVGALGNESGVPVTAINEGQAFGQVNFSFTR